MRHLVRLWILSCIVGLTMLFSSSPVGAENPGDLQADLADDGVYIAPARAADADPDAVLPVIERAQAEGITMQVVWPSDPQPNTGAFARRVQELNQVDVVLVFGPESELGSFVSEDFDDGAVRAINAARQANGPGPQAEACLPGLLEEPTRERPAIINTLVSWIVILIVVLVAAAVGEQMIRQYRRSRQRRLLEQETDLPAEQPAVPD